MSHRFQRPIYGDWAFLELKKKLEEKVTVTLQSLNKRILSLNTPDRVQTDLMGQRFQRPIYWDWSLLELKKKSEEKVIATLQSLSRLSN
jgi:hypothetical protein